MGDLSGIIGLTGQQIISGDWHDAKKTLNRVHRNLTKEFDQSDQDAVHSLEDALQVMQKIEKGVTKRALRRHLENINLVEGLDGLMPIKKEDYDDLKASCEKYGFLVPLILDENDNLVDGYNRYKIAKELGITHVPVIWVKNELVKDPFLFALEVNSKRRNKIPREKIGEIYEKYALKRGRPKKETEQSQENQEVEKGVKIADLAPLLGVSKSTLKHLRGQAKKKVAPDELVNQMETVRAEYRPNEKKKLLIQLACGNTRVEYSANLLKRVEEKFQKQMKEAGNKGYTHIIGTLSCYFVLEKRPNDSSPFISS